MSIANFDSEREAKSFINKHLFKMHGVNVATTGVNMLLPEDLFRLHSMFHMDGYMALPHSHHAEDVRQIKQTFDDDYIQVLIDLINQKEE